MSNSNVRPNHHPAEILDLHSENSERASSAAKEIPTTNRADTDGLNALGLLQSSALTDSELLKRSPRLSDSDSLKSVNEQLRSLQIGVRETFQTLQMIATDREERLSDVSNEREKQMLELLRTTSRSCEIIAGAVHDLQGSVAQVRTLVSSLAGAQEHESLGATSYHLQEIRSQLDLITERLEDQRISIEKSDMQRQLESLTPDEGSGRKIFLAMFVFLFFSLNTVGLIAIYMRLLD